MPVSVASTQLLKLDHDDHVAIFGVFIEDVFRNKLAETHKRIITTIKIRALGAALGMENPLELVYLERATYALDRASKKDWRDGFTFLLCNFHEAWIKFFHDWVYNERQPNEFYRIEFSQETWNKLFNEVFVRGGRRLPRLIKTDIEEIIEVVRGAWAAHQTIYGPIDAETMALREKRLNAWVAGYAIAHGTAQVQVPAHIQVRNLMAPPHPANMLPANIPPDNKSVPKPRAPAKPRVRSKPKADPEEEAPTSRAASKTRPPPLSGQTDSPAPAPGRKRAPAAAKKLNPAERAAAADEASVYKPRSGRKKLTDEQKARAKVKRQQKKADQKAEKEAAKAEEEKKEKEKADGEEEVQQTAATTTTPATPREAEEAEEAEEPPRKRPRTSIPAGQRQLPVLPVRPRLAPAPGPAPSARGQTFLPERPGDRSMYDLQSAVGEESVRRQAAINGMSTAPTDRQRTGH